MSEASPGNSGELDPTLLLPPTNEDIQSAISEVDRRLRQDDVFECIKTEVNFKLGSLSTGLQVTKNYDADDNTAENEVSIFVFPADKSEDGSPTAGLVASMPFNRRSVIVKDDHPESDLQAKVIGYTSLYFAVGALTAYSYGKKFILKDVPSMSETHDALFNLLENDVPVVNTSKLIGPSDTGMTSVEETADSIREILQFTPIFHTLEHERGLRKIPHDKDGNEVMAKYSQVTNVSPEKVMAAEMTRMISVCEHYPARDGNFDVVVTLLKTIFIPSNEPPYITITSYPRIPLDEAGKDYEKFLEYIQIHQESSELNSTKRHIALKGDLYFYLNKLLEARV